MKKILINSERFGNHEILIDDCDYELVSQYRWHVHKNKNTFYACHSFRNKFGKDKGVLYMHKLIIGTEGVVDHADGNGLNNQRLNLRKCSYSQNNANLKSRKNASSKFLGVSWSSKYLKWRATIQKNYKSKSLGFFENEIDAAKAYNIEAKKLHGEFANLNIIPDGK